MAISDSPSDVRQAGLTRQDRAALARAPRRPPDQQWWNIPAKVRTANRIAEAERRRAGNHRNDAIDAMRHARWANRTAARAGPIFTTVVGFGHEVDNLIFDGHPLSEALMDLRNNAEGVAATQQRRPIDRSSLQSRPLSLTAAGTRAAQEYEDHSRDRAAYPSRPYGQGTPAKGYKDAPGYEPEERYPARRYRPYPGYR